MFLAEWNKMSLKSDNVKLKLDYQRNGLGPSNLSVPELLSPNRNTIQAE
jgi:hypothetical protein